ncbi:MAG: hypothetical protein K8R99_01610 [Actinomycetia bacterium]|nr:hypothetical protein [Actinomycetes bacterium]
MSTTRLKFVPVIVCLAFGLAACGDDAKSSDDVTTPAEGKGDYDFPSATTVAEASDSSVDDSTDTSVDDSGSGGDVILTESALGSIITDSDGNTLYLYTPDGTDTPTCTGGCAGAWPAFVTDEDHVHVGDGLDEALFAVVDGPNGTQVSFNGHPLYYFGGDSAPGDTNGQGSGGVWYVLGADGEPITN